MKVKTAKALCWEHGYTHHLVDGREDGIFNFGVCVRCLFESIRDTAERRAFVRQYKVS